MQPETDLGNPVAFQAKVDAAAKPAYGTSLPFDGPAEPFTTVPAGGDHGQKLLGVSQLVAA